MGILRTMLALAIVIYHSFTVFGLRMTGGQVSVQSFYLISGFYMALILNEKYLGKGIYWTFIKARFMRIFPMYWLILILATLLSAIGYLFFSKPFYFHSYVQHAHVLSPLVFVYFIFENISIIGQDALLFLKVTDAGEVYFTQIPLLANQLGFHYMLIPQAWSISIELLFYLLAPFLLRKNWPIQVFLVALFFAWRFYFASKYFLYFDPWTHRFFPFELSYFLLGSLSFKLYVYLKHKKIDNRIGYALLGFILLFIWFYNEAFVDSKLKMYLFYVYIFVSMPFIFISFKDFKVDRWIGELSFSIYISHHLIVMVLHDIFFKHPKYIDYYGYTTIFLSLFLAIILNQCFQMPIERWRQKYIAKSVTTG
jgi:peptidoglycan/LPS O-acetylase OafA/YrhL